MILNAHKKTNKRFYIIHCIIFPFFIVSYTNQRGTKCGFCFLLLCTFPSVLLSVPLLFCSLCPPPEFFFYRFRLYNFLSSSSPSSLDPSVPSFPLFLKKNKKEQRGIQSHKSILSHFFSLVCLIWTQS